MNAPKFILDVLETELVLNYKTLVSYTYDVFSTTVKEGFAISIYDLGNVGFMLMNAYDIPVREGDIYVSRHAPRRDLWVIDEKQIIDTNYELHGKSAKSFDTSNTTLWRHLWSPHILEMPGILGQICDSHRKLYLSYADRARFRSEGNVNFSQPLPLP